MTLRWRVNMPSYTSHICPLTPPPLPRVLLDFACVRLWNTKCIECNGQDWQDSARGIRVATLLYIRYSTVYYNTPSDETLSQLDCFEMCHTLDTSGRSRWDLSIQADFRSIVHSRRSRASQDDSKLIPLEFVLGFADKSPRMMTIL